MMRSILIITALVLLSGCLRDGPLLIDVPTDRISAELDKAVPTLMQDANVVGMSIVVIRDGAVSLSKSFGYADSESHRKIDKQTIYRAASLGKPVFAYIVMSLAQQGEIDLDTPLYSYLKQEVVKDDARSRSITARMVLSHTTGLPNLDGSKSEPKFQFDPATNFKYSGHAYLYLQKVIEKITAKQLNQLANEIVFQPLKMADSSYVWQDKYRTRISSSYDNSGKAFQSKETPLTGYSAWSLFTTISDYAGFVSHMINAASIPGSVGQTMLRPQVDVAKKVKWSLGWGLQETTPNPSFWHWGSMAGFRHFVVGYPEEKIAVIVMTNSRKAFKVVEDVMAKAIGGSYPSYDWF